MADVASKDSAAQDGARRKGRWLPMAFATVAAGVLTGVAYFGLQFFRDSAYEDERAFRVLGHVVGQFGNFQLAVSGALKLVRTSYRPDPTPHYEVVAAAEFQRALALRNVKLGIDTKADADTCRLPWEQGTSTLLIETTSPARQFSMCRGLKHVEPAPENKRAQPEPAKATPGGSEAAQPKPLTIGVTLSGPLADQLPAFIGQDLFDTVVIASANGKTIASLPRGQDRGYEVQLHKDIVADPLGGDAAELLRRAAGHMMKATATETDAAKEPPDHARPAYATVFTEKIGGRPFRVFVLPFVPAHATVVDQDTPSQLYLIALKEQRVLGAMDDALGSGGALVVTLSVLLGILAWPLISLRFGSPQEAIAPAQLFAVLISLLLMPAVIATTGFSLWTGYRLMLVTDQHAESYARRVEEVLTVEVDSDLDILESLAQQLEGYAPKEFESPKNEDPEHPRTSDNAVCVAGHDCASDQLPLQWHRPPGVPEDWSAIRSAAPLNRRGESSGLVLNFFSASASSELNLPDREYFQAIMQHEEWQPGELWPHHDSAGASAGGHRYVAQRLFNRTDAALVLQLAIPIDKDGNRVGVMTGDSRVYGLSQTLRPPLLRFAVFDSRNGVVLFHSRDRLSLAENLLIETEHNSSLEAVMQRRASPGSQRRITSEDHFSGRYLSAAHRFVYRSVPGAPWGIVVFYPTDGIDDIVLQTAVATLAFYLVFVIAAALVMALLVLALPERADLAALKWLWPKWQSRDRYPRVAYYITLALAAIAMLLLGRLYRFEWQEIAVALLVGSAVVWGAGRLRARWFAASGPGAPSLTAYKRSYVQCVFGVLALVSALPTILIAIGYHDTSVAAVIRDELEDAAGDEQQRRHTLWRDHWRFTDGQALLVDALGNLSRALPIPGYRLDTRPPPPRPTPTPTATPAWLVTDVEPTPWLNECGPPQLGTLRREIWSLSTARQVQRPLGRRPDSPEQQQTMQTECPRNAVHARLRSEDGQSTSIALPLKKVFDDTDFVSPPLCEQGQESPPPMCRDDGLDSRYTSGSGFALAMITFVCVLLVTLLSAVAARRLFGIRIPFAGRFVPSGADAQDASQLLDAELELLELKKANERELTSKDESDWRAVNCWHIYERMWNALRTDEQLLLHQLAGQQFANPENQAVIERLLRRGYLTLAPWPRIVEPGFADFVRTVQTDEMFDQLKYESTHTVWSQLRTPLLFIVVIVAGLLMWLAGSTMHILAAVLGGVAALFGSIAQVTNFIHRDKPPSA